MSSGDGFLGLLVGVVAAGAPALVAILRTVDRAKRAERALEKFEEKNAATVERIHGRIDELRDELRETWLLMGKRPGGPVRRPTGTVMHEVDDSSSER